VPAFGPILDLDILESGEVPGVGRDQRQLIDVRDGGDLAFDMNTQAELQRAVEDYREGRMGRVANPTYERILL
jgi:hypothetical protein